MSDILFNKIFIQIKFTDFVLNYAFIITQNTIKYRHTYKIYYTTRFTVYEYKSVTEYIVSPKNYNQLKTTINKTSVQWFKYYYDSVMI
jgi:hypothetical protein